MLASAVPAKFSMAFATSATAGYIRTIPSTTVDPNAASLTLGFPPNTSTPVASGGVPPNIQDFNGVLNQSTAWNLWQAAGGPVYYDGTFSSSIGGYPAGALISNASTLGTYWLSTVDNNTSNPDTGGANWTSIILTGLGTAAYKNTTDNTKANVAAVSGSITTGHLVIFADSSGTIADGGAPATFGTAAQKTASNNSQTYLSSVVGGTTIGHIAVFSDGFGSITDGGALPSYGTAATKAASNNGLGYLASVQSAANGQVAVFTDSNGTIQSGGVLGSAAFRAASNSGYSYVASVASASAGGVAIFTDNNGTIASGGSLGSAAFTNASNPGYGVVAAVSSAVAGQLAVFTDNNGTIGSGGSTPAFSSLAAPNGYIIFPGGIIDQWCAITVYPSSSYGVFSGSWPLPFPNACWNAVATSNSKINGSSPYVSSDQDLVIISSISTTGFTIRLDSNQGAIFGGAHTIYLRAIGN